MKETLQTQMSYMDLGLGSQNSKIVCWVGFPPSFLVLHFPHAPPLASLVVFHSVASLLPSSPDGRGPPMLSFPMVRGAHDRHRSLV